MKGPVSYQDAGVNPEKAAEILGDFSKFLGSRPRDPRIISGIGPFASCFSLKSTIAEMSDPILVTCCDGVGTKLKLALDWDGIETLGTDLVAMNVNDLLCAGAAPMLFLDYYACGKLDDKQLTTLLKSIQEACEASLCSLVGGETAEMPGLYQPRDFDLAGFAVGIADKKHLLGPARVKKGNVLIGLPSSGPHSNGYSLVRKLVEREKISATDRPSFTDRSWKEVLLAPTVLYVEGVAPLIPRLSAAAHITGGGLYENLPRVLPSNLLARIDSKAWSIPPLFRWFQSKGQLTETQLLSTFNCGIGMILAVDESETSSVFAALEKNKLQPRRIGQIENRPSEGPQVIWD